MAFSLDSKQLDWLNVLKREDAELAIFSCCGSKKFAEKVAAARPFASSEHLLQVIDEVWSSEIDVYGVLAAFAAHPPIGGKASAQHASSASARFSEGEQAAAQNSTTAKLSKELAEWNAKYEAKFGHVFLICAAGRRSEEILVELKKRYVNRPLVELQVAAAEQHKITKLRLAKLEAPPGTPKSSPAGSGLQGRLAAIALHFQPSQGRNSAASAAAAAAAVAAVPDRSLTDTEITVQTPLIVATPTVIPPSAPLRPPITTHVLDVALGRPAANIPVSLEALDTPSDFASLSMIPSFKWRTVGTSATDGDGRSGPLMEPSDFLPAGIYRLTFATAAYYGRSPAVGSDGTMVEGPARQSFYPCVTVTFEVFPTQTGQHFHVPVLLSPFSYSTYRGS